MYIKSSVNLHDMYLCSTDSHSKIAEIHICMNILYWSSQFNFGLVIEILCIIKHQFSTCNTYHSTLAAGHLVTFPRKYCFSPIILVLSNMSFPGPNATHNSFCKNCNNGCYCTPRLCTLDISYATFPLQVLWLKSHGKPVSRQ